MAEGCEKPTEPSDRPPFTLEEAYSFDWLPTTDFITQFGFGRDGVLWIATFEGTIVRVMDGESTSFAAASVTGDSPLRDLFVDESGRPWVVAGASVAVFEEDAWVLQTPPDFGGLSPVAHQVAATASGLVLLGVGDADAGGLMLRRDGIWRTLTPDNSDLPSPLVLSMEPDGEGRFWVGSGMFQGKGGLSQIVGDRVVTVFDTSDGLLYNWVDDLSTDADRVFVAFAVPIFDELGVAEGGIQVLSADDGVVNTWFPSSSELTSNRVRSLTYTSSGELWFTTSVDADDYGCEFCVSGVGVMYESGRFDVLSSLNSELEPNEFLPQVEEGPDGEIYVARAEERRIMRVVR